MALISKLAVLLAKAEVTYGVDPTPTGAANAILARNISLTQLEQEESQRDLVLGFPGSYGFIPGSAKARIEFEIEIAGSGTAATNPVYDPLLEACLLESNLHSPSTQVDYALVTPASTNKSVTFYWNVNGVNHKIVGCRGNVSFEFTRDQIPVFKFAFEGLWATPTDVALPTPTFTAFQKPVPFNKVNTTVLTLHGYAVKASSLSIDLGNTIDYKARVNTTEYCRIPDRNVTGSITFEAETVATKDWWTIIRGATTGAFAMTHGSTTGNIVQLAGAAVQLGKPSYADEEGVLMLTVPLIFQPTPPGNNEITFTTK